MAEAKILWNPQGFESDALGTNSYLRSTDGDIPHIAFSIRMLSIDAPETHYPGTPTW